MSACRSRRSLTPRGSSARPETWPPLSAGRGPRQQSPDGAPQPHRREARPDPPPPACWRSATTAPGTSTPLSGRLLRACLTSISTKVETAAAAAFWSGCASLSCSDGAGDRPAADSIRPGSRLDLDRPVGRAVARGGVSWLVDYGGPAARTRCPMWRTTASVPGPGTRTPVAVPVRVILRQRSSRWLAVF